MRSRYPVTCIIIIILFLLAGCAALPASTPLIFAPTPTPAPSSAIHVSPEPSDADGYALFNYPIPTGAAFKDYIPCDQDIPVVFTGSFTLTLPRGSSYLIMDKVNLNTKYKALSVYFRHTQMDFQQIPGTPQDYLTLQKGIYSATEVYGDNTFTYFSYELDKLDCIEYFYKAPNSYFRIVCLAPKGTDISKEVKEILASIRPVDWTPPVYATPDREQDIIFD
jgi:hypothetical protein